MTIRENKNILEGLNVAFIGDGNNMANSLIIGCLKGWNELCLLLLLKTTLLLILYLNQAKEIAENEDVPLQ